MNHNQVEELAKVTYATILNGSIKHTVNCCCLYVLVYQPWLNGRKLLPAFLKLRYLYLQRVILKLSYLYCGDRAFYCQRCVVCIHPQAICYYYNSFVMPLLFAVL